MPSGLPSAAELLEREVGFFSIDTNVIQSLGYRFSDGALSALALQRPAWIVLLLTEIVGKEVQSHRIEPVQKAFQDLMSDLDRLERLSGVDFSEVKDRVQGTVPVEQACQRFDRELSTFIRRFNGQLLSVEGPELAKELFDRYFQCRPPFESRKEKRFEFPDAAALMLLEKYARVNRKKGVLISNDGGWERFAAESEFLYCVKSVEKFASLFRSDGPDADLVVAKIKSALASPASGIANQLDDEASYYFDVGDWHVGDLYSGFNVRLEGAVYNVELVEVRVFQESAAIWFCEHDPSVCVVELNAAANLQVSVTVEFFQWDSIDRDEIPVGSTEVTREVDIECNVFLTCTGELLVDPVADWQISIEMSSDRMIVDVGEIDPDFGGEG